MPRFMEFVDRTWEFFRRDCSIIMPTPLIHLITSSFWLLCGVVDEAAPAGHEFMKATVHRLFLFTLTRSLTGTLGVVDAWENMACTYDFHKGLNTYLLGPIDDIVEVLEDIDNLIQTMLGNRFVEFLFEKVSLWQRNLGAVDTCMIRRMDMQRQWSNLYLIFMLSEDIKTQLPEQAKEFARCGELFRSMMDKAHNFTNVIEVCTSDSIRKAMGREDTLEQMLIIMEDILTSCEKALAD